MSAFIVAMVSVTNPDVYKNYMVLSGPAAKLYGGEFVIRGGEFEVLEGQFPHKRIVMLKFSSVAQAKKFYNSVEYQAARKERLGAADFNMIVVAGPE
jgi:uncharacterized protein (DUF1330 family)